MCLAGGTTYPVLQRPCMSSEFHPTRRCLPRESPAALLLSSTTSIVVCESMLYHIVHHVGYVSEDTPVNTPSVLDTTTLIHICYATSQYISGEKDTLFLLAWSRLRQANHPSLEEQRGQSDGLDWQIPIPSDIQDGRGCGIRLLASGLGTGRPLVTYIVHSSRRGVLYPEFSTLESGFTMGYGYLDVVMSNNTPMDPYVCTCMQWYSDPLLQFAGRPTVRPKI